MQYSREINGYFICGLDDGYHGVSEDGFFETIGGEISLRSLPMITRKISNLDQNCRGLVELVRVHCHPNSGSAVALRDLLLEGKLPTETGRCTCEQWVRYTMEGTVYYENLFCGAMLYHKLDLSMCGFSTLNNKGREYTSSGCIISTRRYYANPRKSM
jgi:hypothetical protein